MRPDMFPCFYSAQCRGPVADMVRDHIVAGSWTPKELVQKATLQTLGPYRLYAESPFVGDYTVGNAKILSDADLHGVMLYRINNVILHHRQLAAFQASTPPTGTVTQEKVVTTYRTPDDYPIPGGGYEPGVHEVVTEKTYVTPGSRGKRALLRPPSFIPTATARPACAIRRAVTTAKASNHSSPNQRRYENLTASWNYL